MAVSITLDQIGQLAPHCLPAYRAAFGDAAQVLGCFAINASSLRLAHFMAQVMHETGALTLLYEDLDYSTRRLPLVWPTRFMPRGPLDPRAYAHEPRKLANAVYAGRLGNVGADDGYTFRGRGLLQLTGKDSYARATTALCKYAAAVPDFTRDPDAVLLPVWCLPVAAAHWQGRGCNAAADRDAIEAAARMINGGAAGMAQRHAWYRRTRAIWLG